MNILKDELSEIYKDKFLISEDELDEILFDKYEKNLNILCADSLKTDLCEVFSIKSLTILSATRHTLVKSF